MNDKPDTNDDAAKNATDTSIDETVAEINAKAQREMQAKLREQMVGPIVDSVRTPQRLGGEYKDCLDLLAIVIADVMAGGVKPHGDDDVLEYLVSRAKRRLLEKRSAVV